MANMVPLKKIDCYNFNHKKKKIISIAVKMKVNYINILLFALPLNILVHNQRNHKSTTPHHTPKITTTRLLCECELYAPANYDNDTEMKKVMENFNKQTQQRFHEYDDRMVEKTKAL
ncbi:rifin PIR protein, putative [Plasmodium reichenowi]|uniref:Rifin PIR protein, putative n=1 Tax=Plasmodium reichenowi TaxID=5854 RepID=A0A2P9DSJ0_PLARE|nr:rifin PIR protein, putative [Plasmodium reichenowi]